jgi:hypothetical protein
MASLSALSHGHGLGWWNVCRNAMLHGQVEVLRAIVMVLTRFLHLRITRPRSGHSPQVGTTVMSVHKEYNLCCCKPLRFAFVTAAQLGEN